MDRQSILPLAAGLCAAGAVMLAGCATSGQRESTLREYYLSEIASISSQDGEPAYQPQELNEQSGLSDYLAYAALNNPGLEASFNQWKAAVERVPQVTALPDPRFTYQYYIREVETRVGGMRQSFKLSQTFPWFGKLALRGDVAAQAANAQHQRFEAKKLKLFYQVKNTYYEYYYLRRALSIVESNRDLVKHFESVARTRYKTATASHPDVVKAQLELGKLEDRLATLKDLRGPIAARLNAVLNRPVTDPLPWPAALEDREVSLTDEALLAWLSEANPELKALDFEIARDRHRIELARKDYFPDLTLGAQYIELADSTSGRNPSGDGTDAVSIGASINLPIWWNKLAAGVRESRYRYLRSVHRKQDRTNLLGAELKLVFYQFRDAERKISLYRDTLIPKATESVKTTETSFKAGKGTFLDLIDSQRILLEFGLAYERALASRLQRLGELEMLVGKEIPSSGNPKAVSGVKASGAEEIAQNASE